MTRVFIACCLFRPHPDYLRAQLASFRAQTHGNWRCLLQEDGEPASEALVRSLVGDDPTATNPEISLAAWISLRSDREPTALIGRDAAPTHAACRSRRRTRAAAG